MPILNSQPKPDRLLHSLLSQGGGKIFSLFVAIVISGWTARYLGPQQLGTLSYAAALVGLLGPIGNLGVKGSLSGMLCEKQPLPGLLGSALLIEIVGTLIIALVLIPFAWAANDPFIAGLIALGIVGNLLSSSEVFEVELLNREQGTLLARNDTIQTVAGAVLSVLALIAQAPLLVFGGLPVVKAAIGSWLLARSVQAINLVHLLKQASWITSRALIKRGWPLIFSGLSVVVYMKSDQVMLEWLKGSEDLGQYSVAVKLSESLYFLPLLISKTFLPRIGRGTGVFESDLNLRQLYQLAWLCGVGMTLTSMFLLPLLVPLVFGDKFIPASSALVWLGPAAFAVSTGCASGAWLNTQGYQKIMAQRTALGAVANIVLNLLFIPWIGNVGAALSTSISYFLSVYSTGAFRKEVLANTLNLLFPFRYGNH